MRFIYALVMVFASATGLIAQETVRYMPERGNASPELDIYANGITNAPVIIYVHGGAWVMGNFKQVRAKPRYFMSEGYVFVSLEYTLVPDADVEGQLAEIDVAIGWVADNIAQYGGDPDNLNLMGHSAGAHLVAMTGVRPLERTAELVANGALRSVIANNTRAYDIPRIASLSREGKLSRLYARPFGQDQNRWRALSPIYNIVGGAKPAFLILYSGQGNDAVRRSFAEEFADALRQSGGQAVLFDGSNLSHAQINRTIGMNNAVTAAIDGFLTGQR